MKKRGAVVKQYCRDGYYVANGLLPKADVLRVRDSLIKNFVEQLKLSHSSEDFSDGLLFELMQRLFHKNLSQYKKTVSALWRKLDVYQLMHHEKIIQFLRDQFVWSDIFVPGGQIVLIMSHELRIQDGYFGISAHQDFPSVQGSLDGVVVWLPLVKVDSSNFPLEVIPGSHMQGLIPTISDEKAQWQLDPKHYREDQFVKLEAEPGDVVFMSLFTVHRSAIDGEKNRLRVALSTRFDNGDESSFVDRIYPSAYNRSVTRAPIRTDFPVPDQVRRVFKISEGK
ncbi:phytanoyl-CoA dioxygenase family protein [Undibacterium sp. LX40W]|uniref:Phytanoyl-CoA dioxygenase family protein n=1 Tax=Undibacterium nitidum TaxID=2762298 RepID=A0A923HUF2_9BURK|nr:MULTISPECIES: phytanoyl-CoA dioxygenase family protein [Undibacterium]MBC3880286.1 phytanoyl-CoA dioxygenase family protein [Undibacterium nitidum]MBC3890978.1 phytanoyl-CoA dioxygenase family protein [Undibacterium sp. LX40W]